MIFVPAGADRSEFQDDENKFACFMSSRLVSYLTVSNEAELEKYKGFLGSSDNDRPDFQTTASKRRGEGGSGSGGEGDNTAE